MKKSAMCGLLVMALLGCKEIDRGNPEVVANEFFDAIKKGDSELAKSLVDQSVAAQLKEGDYSLSKMGLAMDEETLKLAVPFVTPLPLDSAHPDLQRWSFKYVHELTKQTAEARVTLKKVNGQWAVLYIQPLLGEAEVKVDDLVRAAASQDLGMSDALQKLAEKYASVKPLLPQLTALDPLDSHIGALSLALSASELKGNPSLRDTMVSMTKTRLKVAADDANLWVQLALVYALGGQSDSSAKYLQMMKGIADIDKIKHMSMTGTAWQLCRAKQEKEAYNMFMRVPRKERSESVEPVVAALAEATTKCLEAAEKAGRL